MDPRLPLQHQAALLGPPFVYNLSLSSSNPRCRPEEEYEDVSSADDERLMSLSPGLFLWLMNIRLGYMVLVIDRGVIIELHTLSRYARQFSYDHLYVGNPNSGSKRSGSLLDAAKA